MEAGVSGAAGVSAAGCCCFLLLLLVVAAVEVLTAETVTVSGRATTTSGGCCDPCGLGVLHVRKTLLLENLQVNVSGPHMLVTAELLLYAQVRMLRNSRANEDCDLEKVPPSSPTNDDRRDAVILHCHAMTCREDAKSPLTRGCRGAASIP